MLRHVANVPIAFQWFTVTDGKSRDKSATNETTMADDETIYVDAGEPALLHDGSVHTEYHTVADAKTTPAGAKTIRHDRDEPPRLQRATNKSSALRTESNAVDAALSFVDVAPNFLLRDAPWPPPDRD